MTNENKSFTIKVSGKMYIGDLCYAMSREDYHNYWGNHYYQDGAYTTPDGMFAMVSTANGDGCYRSNIGFDFCVDAGIIGICDGDLVKRDAYDLGVMVDAVGEATISYNDGTISISYTMPSGEPKVVEIETAYSDEDYYEYEEDEEDEDYEE